MNQIQFLQAQIADYAPTENLEVERLIATYLVAKEQSLQFEEVMAAAKTSLRQIVENTGVTKWETASGNLLVPADAVVVSYNAAALDAVRLASKTVNKFIYPHRKETLRSGGIRITGK